MLPSAGSGPITNATFQIQTDRTIPVVFHVITGNGGVGSVTDAQIADQIDVLNAAFVPPSGGGGGGAVGARFYFELLGVSRIQRQDWHTGFDMNHPVSGAEDDAKQALTVDPAHVLNVYVVDLPSTQLGYAWYPFPNESGWRAGVGRDRLPAGR